MLIQGCSAVFSYLYVTKNIDANMGPPNTPGRIANLALRPFDYQAAASPDVTELEMYQH